MKRLLLGFGFFMTLLLAPQLSPSAFACSCGGTIDIGSALARADAVFTGQVVWGDTFRARIQVDKIWKGEERSEIVMRTGAKDLGNGMMTMSSCDYNYVVGQRYVVYATGTPDNFIVPGCGRTRPTDAAEIAALDDLVKHKKVGSEIRRCDAASPAERSTGEIRLVIASSKETAVPNARTMADASGQQFATLTDNTGRAVFSALEPGEYKVTVDLEGYAPKQLTLFLPSKACTEAAIFLSPLKN